MLDNCEGDSWVSRRDDGVRLPLSVLTRTTPEATPYVAAQVLLFYKAKNPREKDLVDLTATVGLLTPDEMEWLRNAISLAYGNTHPWLAELVATP